MGPASSGRSASRSTSPGIQQAASGLVQQPVMSTNPAYDAAVTLAVDDSGNKSAQEPDPVQSAFASGTTTHSVTKPLDSSPPTAEQMSLRSTAPQVFRDPVGSSWGGADASKAIKSLSSCPSANSRKGSLSLGHEDLFSAGLFTVDDWKAHTSFSRWLPEPVYLCALPCLCLPW